MNLGGTVRWGQRPLGFELRSTDDDVLGRASLIFRPWAEQASASPTRIWRIDPLEGVARGWQTIDFEVDRPSRHDTIAAAVRAVEFEAVQALFDLPSTRALHGALLVRRGHGLVLLGAPETGKSTLACALWTHGWGLLGDDITLVDVSRGVAWTAPRRVGLRDASRPLLGEGFWARLLATPAGERTSDGCLFHPDEVDGRPRHGVVSLAGLVFLGRPESRCTTGPTRLAPAHALVALMPYTNLAFRMTPGELIPLLRPLAERMPAWDLPRMSLETMVDAVERLVEVEA